MYKNHLWILYLIQIECERTENDYFATAEIATFYRTHCRSNNAFEFQHSCTANQRHLDMYSMILKKFSRLRQNKANIINESFYAFLLVDQLIGLQAVET